MIEHEREGEDEEEEEEDGWVGGMGVKEGKGKEGEKEFSPGVCSIFCGPKHSIILSWSCQRV